MRDVFTLAEFDTRLTKVAHGEYAGPCPGCGGNDRFRVRLKEGVWKWMCRNCYDAQTNGWGDAIEYCRRFRSMEFPEARDYVNELEDARERVEKALGTVNRKRTENWQERARQWTSEAIGRLKSDEGQEALAYLLARGLKPETIEKARLGYARYKHPKTKRVVPCIVFPWYVGEQIVKVQLRDFRPDVPHDERYFMLPGSNNDALYLIDSLTLQRPATIVVEGEFDALIAAQECGDIANAIATGSTDGGRSFRNVAKLARCNLVLLALDNESKGENAATWWLERLDNAIRYRPLAHDVNDMLLAGYDVRSWIEAMLELEGEVDVDPDTLCSVCGAEVEHFSADGKPLCNEHYQAFMHALSADDIQAKLAEALPDWQIDIAPAGTFTHPETSGHESHTTSGDFWAKVRAGIERPPRDSNGVPYYTVERWKIKLAELRAFVPQERFSHYPGGYASYCRMYRHND